MRPNPPRPRSVNRNDFERSGPESMLDTEKSCPVEETIRPGMSEVSVPRRPGILATRPRAGKSRTRKVATLADQAIRTSSAYPLSAGVVGASITWGKARMRDDGVSSRMRSTPRHPEDGLCPCCSGAFPGALRGDGARAQARASRVECHVGSLRATTPDRAGVAILPDADPTLAWLSARMADRCTVLPRRFTISARPERSSGSV